MQVYRDWPERPLERPAVITVGNFDGLHRGHQFLIATAVEQARGRGCLAGAVTFYPLTRQYFAQGRERLCLTSLEERIALIGRLGVDFVLVLPFTAELVALGWQQFIVHLNERAPLCGWVCGENFTFGHKRVGTAERLAEYGRAHGFDVTVLKRVREEGHAVSSTSVRHAIEQGDMPLARLLLGRPYHLAGRVVSGQGRGRTLGFPTANVGVASEKLLPARGVYAAWARWNGAEHQAVLNVGSRPTFDNGELSVEVFLLDFAGDLYGRWLCVWLEERLRPELKFASITELVEQMKRDVAEGGRLLSARANAHEENLWIGQGCLNEASPK